MLLEFDCRVCRRPFTPTREAILAGPSTYRRCEACRAIDALTGSVVRENPGGAT